MWILADWLREYRPRLEIKEGSRTLRNARLYAEGLQMERSTVYVGKAEDFIDGISGRVICANAHDIMLLETGDIDEVLNRILDAFDYYNSWADRIKDKIKDDCTLDDILRESQPVLGRAVCVADASFYVLAQAGFERWGDDNPDTKSLLSRNIITLGSIKAINRRKDIRVSNPHTYMLEVPDSGIRCAVRNIFFRGKHRGWLITDRMGDIPSRGEMDIQDELGDLVERWLESHQNQKERMDKAGVFLQILEGTCRRGEDGYIRIESLSWRRDDRLFVYVIRGMADSIQLSFSMEQFERLGAAYPVRFENNLVIVFNADMMDTAPFEEALLQLLERADCFCGKSPAFYDAFDLRAQYELAIIASDFGDDRLSRIREIENAALPYYLSLIVKNDRAGLTHPALRVLRDYDAKNRTQLYRTLEVYLQCERNFILASKALHIHRNSLIYRIGRIVDLTSIDLDSYKTRMSIMLAFEIERYKEIEREQAAR